jgi:hypothetical protein|tara:strand:- start:510 stop:1181 length:672 start_codon:yes stop_codon:yes gene_type:complete
MYKDIFTVFYFGSSGNFIQQILAHYQKSKQYINFNIDPTGHSHDVAKLPTEIIKKDKIYAGEFHNWWQDTGTHLGDSLPMLRKKYENKRILLIDFNEQDVDFITRMYWGKIYKKTLTRERYEYCRSLIHNGSTWAEFERWQDDPEACRHLFEMHRASNMPWINDIDRSLVDLILPFDDIFNSPMLNKKLASWCDSEPDSFIDEYIDRYRKVNKKIYNRNNFKL